MDATDCSGSTSLEGKTDEFDNSEQMKSEPKCKDAINESADSVCADCNDCGEANGLSILMQFQRLNEARVQRVDREVNGDFERVSAKMQIMEEWIKDLSEQNIMLVRIVEDLEQTAHVKVKLLEQKLYESSSVIAENMAASAYTQAITDLSSRIDHLQQAETIRQEKINLLQQDVKGLLKFIVSVNNGTDENWNTGRITPNESLPAKNALMYSNCTCDQEEIRNNDMQSLKLQVQSLQKKEEEMIAYQRELEEKVATLSNELTVKEEALSTYASTWDNSHKNVMALPSKSQMTQHTEENSENSTVNKELTEVRNELMTVRERIAELIDKLESQENVQRKKGTKISVGVARLKRLKNQINSFRHHGFLHDCNNKENCQEHCAANCQGDYAEALSNNFLNIIESEIEQILNNSDMFYNEDDALPKPMLIAVKDQLFNVSSSINELQRTLAETRTSEGIETSPNDKPKDITLQQQEINSTNDEPCNSDIEESISGSVRSYNSNLNHQFKQDITNVTQLLETLQDRIHATDNSLREMEQGLHVAMKAERHYSHVNFPEFATILIERLNKHTTELKDYQEEIEKLQQAVRSKDKLLENMDKVTQMQKDSIAMMQLDLEEVRAQLHEKINTQNQIICQYETEKNELLKQNELQIQTIGHLQSAIVEAKRNLDHLGRKAVADVSEAWSPISPSTCPHGSVHEI